MCAAGRSVRRVRVRLPACTVRAVVLFPPFETHFKHAACALQAVAFAVCVGFVGGYLAYSSLQVFNTCVKCAAHALQAVAFTVCVGFVGGYLAYDCLHCAMHARGAVLSRWRLLARSRQSHMHHHYRSGWGLCYPLLLREIGVVQPLASAGALAAGAHAPPLQVGWVP